MCVSALDFCLLLFASLISENVEVEG